MKFDGAFFFVVLTRFSGFNMLPDACVYILIPRQDLCNCCILPSGTHSDRSSGLSLIFRSLRSARRMVELYSGGVSNEDCLVEFEWSDGRDEEWFAGVS